MGLKIEIYNDKGTSNFNTYKGMRIYTNVLHRVDMITVINLPNTTFIHILPTWSCRDTLSLVLWKKDFLKNSNKLCLQVVQKYPTDVTNRDRETNK